MADGAFNPGTGTLQSTDLPSAFIELAMLIQTEEREALVKQDVLTANGLNVPDQVTISANFNNDTITIDLPALPVEMVYNAGKIEVTALDYLEPINAVEPTIDNTLVVTGSDLTSTSKVKAILELAQLIQEDEATAGINNLTVSINGDTNTCSINGTFSAIPVVNANGLIEVQPENYLVVTP